MDVVFIHGYNVTSTKTYGVLPLRLKKAGYKIRNVYLGKYVTLDDDLTMADLVRALQAALEDLYGSKFKSAKFSCVTHSTGGLVVRSWINTYYSDAVSQNPIQHLIMLAPPSHGSRLAELGKSRLSRLRSLVGIEPGLKILDSLELGSSFQWDLDTSWMKKKFHKSSSFFPVVLTGQWIDKKLWDVLVPATYEHGSDGVVRVASANINTQRVLVQPDGSSKTESLEGVPFLILPKISHTGEKSGIMTSVPEKGDHPTLSAILQILEVENRNDYEALEADFSARTRNLQQTELYYDGSPAWRYSQLVFRVTDQLGHTMDDYAIELVDGHLRGDQLPVGFFGDKHKNDVHNEYFVFYLNYDKLSEVKGGRFGFKIRTAPDSPLIDYQELIYLDKSFSESVLKPNQTTTIDVVLKRRINKNVFRLTKKLDYQKITGQPSGDWIE
jgi:hypothetical protein